MELMNKDDSNRKSTKLMIDNQPQISKTTEINKDDEYYLKAIELDPENYKTYQNNGNYLTDQGRGSEAKKYYFKAIDIDPKYRFIDNIEGFLKAEESFLKSIKQDPKDIDTYIKYGIIFKHQNLFEKSKDCYLKAKELDPNYSITYYYLGDLYGALNRNEITRENKCYLTAIELDPKDIFSYKSLISFQNRNKVYSLSEKYLQILLELNPKDSDTHTRFGIFYHLTNRNKEAENSFFTSIKLNPNCIKTFYILANFYENFKKI